MIATGMVLEPNPYTAAIGAFMIAQGLMGLMQSGNQSGTSGANDTAGSNFKTGTSSGGNTTKKVISNGSKSDLGGDGTSNFGSLPPNALAALNAALKEGYKVDFNSKTVTTPDGHTLSANNASNGSASEASLGLPPGTAAKGMEMIAAIAKHNGADGSNVAGGGAGIAGTEGDGSGLAQGEGYDGSGGKSKNKNNDGTGRTPASALVAGLTSSYNGERIGVAADDIFMMVTRRYQLKHDQDAFITFDRPEKGILGSAPKQ
jgi:hypothetical protein